MRKSMRALALALACIIALLSVACSDDKTPSGSNGDNAAAPTDRAWCDSFVEAQTAVIAATSGGDTEQIPALLDAVEADPPEEVSDTVAEFIPQVRDALETQDEKLFESDEFQAADEELDLFGIHRCSSHSEGHETLDKGAEQAALSGARSSWKTDARARSQISEIRSEGSLGDPSDQGRWGFQPAPRGRGM